MELLSLQKLKKSLYKILSYLLLLIKRLQTTGSFTQHFSSTFFTQLVSLIILMLNGAILARWLGPTGKGSQQLILMVPSLFGLFLGGGINVANVYFAGSQRLHVAELTSSSILFACLATILAGLATMGLIVSGWLAFLLPNTPISLIILAMLGFPILLLTSYFAAILRGLQQITTINIINFLRNVIFLGLTIILVVNLNLGVFGSVLAVLIANLVNLIIIGWFLAKVGGKFLPSWNTSVMRTMLSFGLRGYIGNLLQFFNYRLDVFLLNYFLGAGDVGIYSVSARLAELLWQLPNSVSFVIFPKAATTEATVMNRFTPRIFRIVLAITSLGAVGLVIIGEPLIQLIYSPVFTSAYMPMVILLPGVVLMGGSKVLSNEIAGRGYPQYNSINSGVALILTVILDLLLIPRLGITGASIASTVAYTAIFFISIGFYFVVSHKTMPIKTN